MRLEGGEKVDRLRAETNEGFPREKKSIGELISVLIAFRRKTDHVENSTQKKVNLARNELVVITNETSVAKLTPH